MGGSGDTGRWPPEGARTVDLAGTYERTADAGLAHEPAFRALRSVWRRGAEVFAEAELSAVAGAGRLALHPALLDAAVYAWLACADTTGGVRVPFAWEGVSLHPARAAAPVVRVRLAPAGDGAVSVTVTDPAGAPVVSADALVTRPVREAEPAVAAGAADDRHRQRWAPAAPHGASAGAAPRCAVVGEDTLGLAEAWEAEPFEDLAALTGRASQAPDVTVVYADCGADDRTPGAVREWLAGQRSAGARLLVVTRGAVAVRSGEDVRDPAAARVWASVRSAQAEHPGRFTLADVDGSAASLDALRRVALAGEEQLAVRGGAVFTPARPARPPHGAPPPPPTAPARKNRRWYGGCRAWAAGSGGGCWSGRSRNTPRPYSAMGRRCP